MCKKNIRVIRDIRVQKNIRVSSVLRCMFKKNNSWLKIIRGSRFSEVFHYNSHLVGYEVFGVATIVGLAQVLHQGRTVGDPTHKVVGGCVGVVVGEVEHGEVLFAVAFDFHFVYGVLMGYIWGLK